VLGTIDTVEESPESAETISVEEDIVKIIAINVQQS
jgi:hypothetical protein